VSPDLASRVVVVGASAAGLSTAEALRRHGHHGPITVVGDELHEPYDRPPLSKQVLAGAMTHSSVLLREPGHLASLEVDVRHGQRAAALDARHRHVVLAHGGVMPYDRLVVATGVAARRLPTPSAMSVRHTVRSWDDAVALRAALGAARRIVIIGAGVLGTEIAATVSEMGIEVVLASPDGLPMQAVLGARLAGQLRDLHARQGVQLRTGAAGRVVCLEEHPKGGVTVVFEDGGRVRADLVVEAVGSVPAVAWLRGSGVPVGDGVLCDSGLSAGPDVFAAGDVAHWFNSAVSSSGRVEHRTNASEQGEHVARRIMTGEPTPFSSIPYFWTQQLGLKLQAHGDLRRRDQTLIVEGALAEGRCVALFRRGDELSGVVTVGAAKATRVWRQHIQDRMPWGAALELA
jgi:NADPH-dependent 2,4-dienoyl-CoA reductase/sulfur reductase-like enzyme